MLIFDYANITKGRSKSKEHREKASKDDGGVGVAGK